MTEHELDPLVERAVDELRTLPAVAPGTVERVAASAMAARHVDGDAASGTPRWRRRLAYVAIATAACVVGYAARGLVRSAPAPAPAPADAPIPAAFNATASAAGTSVASGVELASNADARPAPVASQFVLQNAHAHRVAVVGDFNGWNPNATPLTRAPGSGLWSVTVPLMPGRHSYAFMVDDTAFVLDPQAPASHDPDLGSRESVIVVGHP
jgi:Carbohydrate-binding module 48 (Isoamylase N-terminal domain)